MKWQWIATIDSIVEGDVTKWPYIMNLPVRDFLTTIIFYQDKRIHEKQQYEKQMKAIKK